MKEFQCVRCDKTLTPALDVDLELPSLPINDGGTVCANFGYGSTKFDFDSFFGVICDNCAELLRNKKQLRRYKLSEQSYSLHEDDIFYLEPEFPPIDEKTLRGLNRD